MAVNLDMTDKLEKLRPELEMIQNQSVKNFTIDCLREAPDYFWTHPSSSSGKYHPPQSNGEGGLVRHTKAVVYFATKLCEVYGFTGDDMDCVLSACILHDIVKYGWPIARPHTTKTHDLEGTIFIGRIAEKTNFSQSLIERISDGVCWHMGRWSTRTDGNKKVFPQEFSRTAEIVHLADVIAAQNQVSLIFLDSLDEKVKINDGTFIMPFGKHKGKTMEEIPSDYLKWISESFMEPKDFKIMQAAVKELNFRHEHHIEV